MTRVARMFSKVMLNFSPIKSLTVCTQMTSTGSMRIKINDLNSYSQSGSKKLTSCQANDS